MMRTIARQLGMTAPALFQYFPSHGDLLSHLVDDLFRKLNERLRQAVAAAPDGVLPAKFLAVAHSFRAGALLFGTPPPDLSEPPTKSM